MNTYYSTDRLGTVNVQTSPSQVVSATRVYDAFGMLVSTTGTPKGVFGYVGAQGYVEDSDSGLKLLGHRYYDPSTGRFLTRDSAKDGRNWYDYVDNNPLKRADPNGHWWWVVVAAVLMVVGVYELITTLNPIISKGKRDNLKRCRQIDATADPDNQTGPSGGDNGTGSALPGSGSGVGGSNDPPPSLGGPIQEPISDVHKFATAKAYDIYCWGPEEGVSDIVSVIHLIWEWLNSFWNSQTGGTVGTP